MKKNSIIQIVMFLLFFFTCQSIPTMRIVETPDNLTSEEHNDLGVLYEKQKKYNLAEKEYKKAIEKKNNWAIPHFNLGNLYYKKKDYPKAEKSYLKAVSIDNKYADCYNNLAYLLYQQKKYKQARTYINKALAIEKKKEYIDTYNKIIKIKRDGG